MNSNSANELFKRCKDNPILSVDDWPYKANAVFNAAATQLGNETLLLVRVEDYRGFSHFTLAKSKNGIDNWQIKNSPTLTADSKNYPEELWGIEDPRITWLNELDCWAICYTSFSHSGPLVSIATTKDFKTFERLGAVLPPENKDAALFPEKFNNQSQWAMLHRPVPSMTNKANIWLCFSENLKHWGQHIEVIDARNGGWWDAAKIGLCTPPMKTEKGWLILYHGVRTTASGSIYRLGAALLDLENPRRLISRTAEWIFGPQSPYERNGDVDDVVFPCGWLNRNGKIYMYYGAADSCIALATAELDDILNFMQK